MDEERKDTLSLRDAIARGFENQESAADETLTAEENAADATSAEAEGAQTEAPVPSETTDSGVQTAPTDQSQANGQAQAMQTLIAALNSLRQQNAQLSQMIRSQGRSMEQQSQAAQESIETPMTSPTLNFRELSYLGEAEQQAALDAWQEAVMSSLMSRMQSEIAPVKQDYEDKRRIAAEDAARAAIFSAPQFSDFAGNAGDIDRIIAASPELAQIEPEKRYMFAGLIARGLKNDPSHKMSTEEIVQLAQSNPDVMRALETKRAQSVRDKNDALPTLTASSGFSNANPLPQNAPAKNKEELDARIRSRFGL